MPVVKQRLLAEKPARLCYSTRLPAGDIDKIVAVSKFTDCLLEPSAPFKEVNDGLSVFLLLQDVRGNDPVVAIAVETITLTVTNLGHLFCRLHHSRRGRCLRGTWHHR